MKRCPQCGMNVDACSVCPMCGGDLAGAPENGSWFETYRFNRWFWRFLFQKRWYLLLFTALSLTGVILALVNGRFSYPQVMALMCLSIAWFHGLYRYSFERRMRFWRSLLGENYITLLYYFSLFLSGIGACIFAFISA